MKLLIVDDEPSIRDGICQAIDWDGYQIQCLTAKDGIRALEVIEAEQPDLVLLDVRMPHLDGLGVMEELQRREIKVKVVILSGYDQFSYAQKALKYGAVDYLIKPCHKKQLLETVLHFKAEIEREQRNRQMSMNLRKQLRDNRSVLQERYLCRILEQSSLAVNETEENFKTLQIQLPLHHIAIAVMELDCQTCILFEEGKSLGERDMALARFGVINIAEEVFEHTQDCKCVSCHEMVAAFIHVVGGTEGVAAQLQTVQRKVQECLGINLTIGVGTITENISDCASSYRRALQTLMVKEVLGSGEIFWYDKVFLKEDGKNQGDDYGRKQVIQAVFSKKAPELYRALQHFFLQLKDIRQTEQYKMHCLALCLDLSRAMTEYGISSGGTWKPEVSLKELLKINLAGEVAALVEQTVREAQNAVINAGANNRLILQQAISYIDDNYQSDISLKEAAEHVSLSPNYFSMIFKQLSGTSFVDYLNAARIAKACELLKDVQYKSYEVAFLVGFKDEKYFSYMFKKVTGYSPSQYRKNYY